MPSSAAATALLDATMPQAQQFEALSHELFEMSSGSMNTFMGVPDFLTLPPNQVQQQHLNANGNMQQQLFGNAFGDPNHAMSLTTPSTGTLGTNQNMNGYQSYQDPMVMANSNNVFDFFNVDPMQIGDQPNLQEWAWEGPSLFDMFDIVNPTPVQGHSSSHG